MNKKHPLFIGLFVIFPLMLLLLSVWGYVFKVLYDKEIIGQGSWFTESEVTTTDLTDEINQSIDGETNHFQATSGVGIITHELLSGSWIGDKDPTIHFDFQGSNQVNITYGEKNELASYQLYDLYGKTNVDILVEYGVSSFRIDFIDRNRLLMVSINKDEEIIINREATTDGKTVSTNNKLVADPILHELITQALGKDKNEEITREDLFNLTELPSMEGVTDLTGLGWAYNLNSINLTHSMISDFSPIKDLRRLRHVQFQSQDIDEEMMNELLKLGLMYDLVLDLSYSQFSSWDVAKQLVQNGHFPFMKTLVIVGTNLDSMNINELQEARDALQVITHSNDEHEQPLTTLSTN